MLAFSFESGMNMPVSYTWHKKDVQVASMMHEYLKIPLPEQWTDSANKGIIITFIDIVHSI